MNRCSISRPCVSWLRRPARDHRSGHTQGAMAARLLPLLKLKAHWDQRATGQPATRGRPLLRQVQACRKVISRCNLAQKFAALPVVLTAQFCERLARAKEGPTFTCPSSCLASPITLSAKHRRGVDRRFEAIQTPCQHQRHLTEDPTQLGGRQQRGMCAAFRESQCGPAVQTRSTCPSPASTHLPSGATLSNSADPVTPTGKLSSTPKLNPNPPMIMAL